MSQYKFTKVPSNDTVATVVTLLVSAWFTAAGAAMLAEPSVEQQARNAHRTPVVTVRQLAVLEEQQPDVRFTVNVVASRSMLGVS
jgi:hypothetical protein